MIKIAITGPECTGKTSLTVQLAALYETTYVPEYARQYLEENGMNYDYRDVLNMAKGQVELGKSLEASATNILFYDTEMLVYQIWLEYYNWEVPAWLTAHLRNRPIDFYLLLDVDLPWIADGQRANPHDREVLFNRFRAELDLLDAPYAIVSGTGKERLENALSSIKEYLRLRCY